MSIVGYLTDTSGNKKEVHGFTFGMLDTFAKIAVQQDQKGIEKYGVPLSDNVILSGAHDWPVMILEELADACKYVIATQRMIQHYKSQASYQKVQLLEQEIVKLKSENIQLQNELIETNAKMNKIRAMATGYLKG